jgi:hypothetical protein
MSIVMQINPFEFFVDADGTPLDSGYIWIGELNKDPRNYPVTAYYDKDLTIPAVMPLRTTNGYVYRSGSPTYLFINGNYSVLVEDSKHRQVFYVADFLLSGNSSAITSQDLVAITLVTDRVVSNYAALLALDTTKYSKATTLGYYAEGDRGGASYYYNGTAWIMVVDADGVSVRQTGAKGDGVTDDTAAVQSALDLSLLVTIPEQTFCKVTASLAGRSNHVIRGVSAELSRLMRTGNYGDTIKFIPISGINPGAIKLENVWFQQVYTFNNGSTYVPGTSTSVNKATSDAHVRITLGQNIRLNNCWFSGAGFGIAGVDCFNVWIDKCQFDGIWDNNVPGLQDTFASINFSASASTNRCDNINISNCRLGGYSSAAPTAVTNGNVTTMKALNAGCNIGIHLQSAERFTIVDCYLGGQSNHSIFLNCMAIIAHGIISGNMLDAAAFGSIQITSYTNSVFPTFIKIHGNTGVGYGLDRNFLVVDAPAGVTSAAYISVMDNTVQYYGRCAVSISNVSGCQIQGNSFAAYNSDNSTSNSPIIEGGLYISPSCKFVRVCDNSFGGGINNPSSPNFCCWGAYFDAVDGTNSASGNRSSGLGSSQTGSLIAGLSQTYPTA